MIFSFRPKQQRQERGAGQLKIGESLSDYNLLLTSTVAKLTKVRGGGGGLKGGIIRRWQEDIHRHSASCKFCLITTMLDEKATSVMFQINSPSSNRIKTSSNRIKKNIFCKRVFLLLLDQKALKEFEHL